MEHRFKVGDTVAIFDGELYPEDRLSTLKTGAQGIIIREGQEHRRKGFDYLVRFDSVTEYDGTPLEWWLYESELVDPYESVNINAAPLL